MTRAISPVGAAQTAPRAPQGVGAVGSHSMLKLGSSGSEVKQLQEQLEAAGFLKPPLSGDFDGTTDAAVRAYQSARGLQVDGIVGQQTWGSFNGESFPPGLWMLKQPATGYSGSSSFGGSSPGSPVSGVDLSPGTGDSKGAQLVNTAQRYLGIREGAGNSNQFSHALGRPSEAWCADFVSFIAKQNGLSLNTASAQGVADYLKSQGTWKGRSNPQPGDAITFRWDGSGGWADHVGMVERVYQSNGKIYVQTIEGNSSDMVRRKTYAIDDPVINGFGRIV